VLSKLFLGVIVAVLVVIPSRQLRGQVASSLSDGERIYARAAGSVFLLEIHDSGGEQVGTASGFLVAEDQILTNAHVADAGAISVRLGSLSVTCEVQRTDRVNDLALCKIPAKSTAEILRFAPKDPSPGATIFALGSPRGFENTITQGLFTAFRDIDGQRVGQISAPISPGSSGGPILNTEGELVGVAVARLKNDQNVNFAVPLHVVSGFLNNQTRHHDSFVDVARSLRANRDGTTFSPDSSSAWQKLNQEFRQILLQGIGTSTEIKALLIAYDLAGLDAELQVAAAKRAIQVAKPPTKDLFTKLARAVWFSLNATPEELVEAEEAATRVLSLGRPDVSDYVLLGGIQYQRERFQEAYITYLKGSALLGSSSDRNAVIYNLFLASDALKRPEEADRWFQKLDRSTVDGYQWVEYGQFLDRQERYGEAGDAYLAAYQKATRYDDMCEAGESYYYGNRYDDALPAARRCIELATLTPDSEQHIQRSHRIIATMLNERGVYEEALSHARQAISLSNSDASAYHQLAKALNNLRRFTEGINASKNAIRLSDGKWPEMHSELGHAHFQLDHWPEAIRAYEKAAELDRTDPVAAFNAGAAAYNGQAYDLALRWYREVQVRDARYEAERVTRTIQQLVARF
jgi:tetratricopeptide (TPR) repeat protein